MKVCVMGLGYIGLPTAVMFASCGFRVHGVDINQEVINSLSLKKPHIEEPGLEETLGHVIEEGNLSFSKEPEEADAFIIAVPTPITKEKKANIDYVRNAMEMIVPCVKEGDLIILESTVPPGTVEKVMIQELQKTGLKVGEEVFVSHSPERVLPGKLFEELVSNDRIVGGINQESADRTASLYKHFVKGTIHITDAKTAEMVKLMENTYRDVNIALANELAQISDQLGCDVWEAIRLANFHPRVNIHQPGPGVGGHCIAVDPWFLHEASPDKAKLIETARRINDETPMYVGGLIEQITEFITKPKVALLGLAYKGNIGDMRESPSLKVISYLKKLNVEYTIYDPYVESKMEEQVSTVEEAVKGADCIIMLTEHSAFKELDYKKLYDLMNNHNIIDTKNVLDEKLLCNIGFQYKKVGKGASQVPYLFS
ncbi:nucleotide sugar dehydrogenase [Bacillus sp. FJAT-44742]|uniref:nucleotide sugar dehydrogenase n=1 Tax=Bacillus sp. FJAT-44742 TaxID=2014005 RepID=UPI0018E27673